MADDEDSSDSTLMRTGMNAFRLAEMAAFASDLGARPIDRLVEDLPALMKLPEGKYAIVAMAVSRRMRSSPAEQAQLQARLKGLEATAAAEVRQRCRKLLSEPA
jgi:hypothetical protein